MAKKIKNNLRLGADFMRQTDIDSLQVNITFVSHRFQDDPDRLSRKKPVLGKLEGTHHTNLQNAVLYKGSPPREELYQRIRNTLSR